MTSRLARALEPAFAWLDLALHREVRTLRARYELSLDEFRGVFVSDGQVDALLSRRGPAPVDIVDREVERQRVEAVAAVSALPRLDRLARTLDLPVFDRLVLFLALAPLVEQKYAPLYAYLNDFAEARDLTEGLALRLAGLEADDPVRWSLAPRGRLCRLRLIERRPPVGPAGAGLARSLTPCCRAASASGAPRRWSDGCAGAGGGRDASSALRSPRRRSR